MIMSKIIKQNRREEKIKMISQKTKTTTTTKRDLIQYLYINMRLITAYSKQTEIKNSMNKNTSTA